MTAVQGTTKGRDDVGAASALAAGSETTELEFSYQGGMRTPSLYHAITHAPKAAAPVLEVFEQDKLTATIDAKALAEKTSYFGGWDVPDQPNRTPEPDTDGPTCWGSVFNLLHALDQMDPFPLRRGAPPDTLQPWQSFRDKVHNYLIDESAIMADVIRRARNALDLPRHLVWLAHHHTLGVIRMLFRNDLREGRPHDGFRESCRRFYHTNTMMVGQRHSYELAISLYYQEKGALTERILSQTLDQLQLQLHQDARRHHCRIVPFSLPGILYRLPNHLLRPGINMHARVQIELPDALNREEYLRLCVHHQVLPTDDGWCRYAARATGPISLPEAPVASVVSNSLDSLRGKRVMPEHGPKQIPKILQFAMSTSFVCPLCGGATSIDGRPCGEC